MESFDLAVDHMPKYHGVAFWFGKYYGMPMRLSPSWQRRRCVSTAVSMQPLSMFSHDRIDAGSELLASRLPQDFTGDVADFGAGWGYLSVELAQKSRGLTRLDLYEADHAALEAARDNLAENCPNAPARFYWHDLAGEPVKDKYDLVIMNPPFHEGHAAELKHSARQ